MSKVRHILLLQPRPDTTQEEIDACRVAVSSLVGRIPGVLDCHWGVNLAAPDRREGLSHGFSMDFSDLESLRAYGPHPEHQSVATLVRATFERIVVLDVELGDGDPQHG
ncbi:MAG: Dabb family protein [Actinomycetales bacterium]|nr:Dabb family protein [Actinomycetales bacterium]